MKYYTIILYLCLVSLHMMAQESNDIVQEVKEGKTKAVELLLEKGANPNVQNGQMKTLLYLATEANNLEMVDLLLNKGALVDFPFDKNGAVDEQNVPDVIDPTPLLYAGAHGHTAIINRLIRENPNLEIRNHYGGNALIPAAEKGHYETAKLLLEKTDIDIDFINYLGWTALLEVVILSKDGDMQLKMAKLLLEHKTDVNIQDKNGRNALYHARKKQNIDLIKLLESYL